MAGPGRKKNPILYSMLLSFSCHVFSGRDRAIEIGSSQLETLLMNAVVDASGKSCPSTCR